MYAVIRPALRSSSRARLPARFIRGRRYPNAHRVQPFHTTRSLAQTPTPTPSPDDANAPVGKSDVEKKGAAAAEAGEAVDAGTATEDPELLAQKLQRSREQTRRYSSALRRTQRRNRAQDLPPIYIPDWFLERSVRLREDAASQCLRSRRSECALSLHNTASGDQASMSMPVSTYAVAFRAVERMIKTIGKRGISEEHRKLLARDFARRMGCEDDVELVQALERGEVTTALWREPGERIPEASTKGPETEQPGAREDGMMRILQQFKRISPIILAEIKATMAASLSAIQPSVGHSFPSAKTNLILHSPSNGDEAILSSAVESLAAELGADVVTLQAQDLAQLAGDYLGDGPEPSPHSIRSLGYETYKYGPDFADEVEMWGPEEPVEDEQDGMPVPIVSGDPSRSKMPTFKVHFLVKTMEALKSKTSQSASNILADNTTSSPYQPTRGQTQGDIQLEDLKLTTLLEALVDTTDLKRNQASTNAARSEQSGGNPLPISETSNTSQEPKLFDPSFQSAQIQPELVSSLPLDTEADTTLSFSINKSSPSRSHIAQKPKIIYVKDIKELNGTQYGSRILQKLEEIVRKQRAAGESIMLLGTTCSEDLTPELSPSGVQGLQSEGAAGFFRTIVVIPGLVKLEDTADLVSAAKAYAMDVRLSGAEKKKFGDINMRHIQDMLRCLDPASSATIADMQRGAEGFRRFSSTFPESYFWSVLSYDDVHRIALTALGLRLLDSAAEQLSWAHVSLAMSLLKASDDTKFAHVKAKATEQEVSLKDHREHMDRLRMSVGEEPLGRRRESRERDSSSAKRQQELNRIKATANAHEKKLMHGIVNPDQIKTTFDQVHVPKETVEAIRTLTSMSLLRPDAFNYGVLATEKISGALLYGPPGTGKTLLAKAVAKESGCAVLEVSGSSIMDKYVGEGEKNVAAIFSLARKLSPCIVFLDEADAIFGTRDSSRERTSHRDILNQFLKEWDGLNNTSVFVMVATNRPFDMDDAVIRRLPRRLLVDLPTQADRKKILEIHLRGEQLDPSVDIDDLAKRTPLYSGSDLKNVAVFAALACVREENEQAALAAAKAAAEAAALEALQTDATSTASTPDASSTSSPSNPTTQPETQPTPTPTLTLIQGQKYTFPDRRTLHARHFDKALQEVSASISENMSSLNAIKKFDEQYGDRRGRRKKMYGFGMAPSQGANEDAARVRT